MTMDYSVAMCTYNGEAYIKQQIDSILNQTLAPKEIIICDDGSTDSTPQIIQEYQRKYPDIFKIYFNEKNLKSVKNFEKAISLCTEEIIFLSDQDDIWATEKAEKMISFFKKKPKIDVLATNGYCIDENGKVHDKYSLWDIPTLLSEANQPVNYHDIILYVFNIATGASMAIRANIKPSILPFPMIKGYHHDEWIATVASEKGKFEMLSEKLFYYRMHKKQQVGGVFFEKTEKQKKLLLSLFKITPDKNSFTSYKRLLKRLSTSYRVIKALDTNAVNQKKLAMIKERFLSIKQECIKLFPIRSRILFINDKILGKRQLKD